MVSMDRREFLGTSAALALGGAAFTAPETSYAQDKQSGGIKMSGKLPFGMGIVAFALDGGFDNPDAKSLVDKVNQLEIPGDDKNIELLAMPTTDIGNIEKIGKVITKARYGITICGFRPGDETPDMMSKDKSEVDSAVSQVYHIMDCAKAVGATRIGGPLIRNHGNLNEGDGRHLEYALNEVAEKAEKMQIYVSQEMLVAWETTGFNCLSNTLSIIQKVGSEYVLIHYDAAHASREELDIISAATELYMSGKFGHCHISGNGRAQIGAGMVSRDLVGFLHNLASLGYGKKGEKVIVETFHPSMYGAVKRVDIAGITKQPPEAQDAFALNEAIGSYQFINPAYRMVSQRMVPK